MLVSGRRDTSNATCLHTYILLCTITHVKSFADSSQVYYSGTVDVGWDTAIGSVLNFEPQPAIQGLVSSFYGDGSRRCQAWILLSSNGLSSPA